MTRRSPDAPLSGLEWRVHKLRELGGLPAAGVRNDEWLYMLEQETRQSLSIEGYFATDQELKAVLAGRKSFPEILNYHRAAQSLYDLALQQHREGELGLSVSLIRHIHSELFRELDARRGSFRAGSIRITGARVTPPTADVDAYVRAFVELVPTLIGRFPLMGTLARLHVLFESIHPFADGNGRAGRILLNYVGISLGLPPIIINGMQQAERETYYQALEAGDVGFHAGFPSPEVAALQEALQMGNFDPLQQLLTEGTLPQLNLLIAAAVEAKTPLQPLRELAPELGVQEATLRQWVQRGHLIALKRGGRLLSHSELLVRPSETGK
ncbi:Fic family protein [Deinococcus oregonensis]|uniref:Fic family protein n=1 Tax=Deinococcus oregonensis TaxID=1805970 RepID=A0ABV6B591_9DEIO